MSASFYPNLSTIINPADLPEELSFLSPALQAIMDKIFYKKLQVIKSPDGSHGFAKISIVTSEPLQLELPIDGFAIVLNPDNVGETIIPLTLSYRWPILGIIKNFDLQSFSNSPEEILNLFDRLYQLNELDLIRQAVRSFEGDLSSQSYNHFIDKINDVFNLTGGSLISFIQEEDELDMITVVQSKILSNTSLQISVKEIIKTIYLASADETVYRFNLEKFSEGLGESIIKYVKRLITPSIDLSMSLAVGLSFPRSVLTPIDSNGNPRPADVLSILVFDAGDFNYSTEGGFGFNEDRTCGLNFPSQIGNTGFVIDIQGAKLDLSERSNFAEADSDGRPLSFRGVFLREASVQLPKYWGVDSATTKITGRNLIIGTEGGLSGTILLESNEIEATFFGLVIRLNRFSVTLRQNTIIESTVKGEIVFENDQKLILDGAYHSTGFSFTASLPDSGDPAHPTPPISISIGSQAVASIRSITFERNNEADSFAIGFSGGIKFLSSDLPLIGDLLPEEVIINKLLFNSQDGLEDFDVKVTWKGDDPTKAVVLQTSDGEATLTVPVNKTIADTLLVSIIKVKLKDVTVPPGNPTSQLQILMTGELHIGIVDASIVDFGLKTNVAFDREGTDTSGSRLGPLSFSATGLVMPSGIGVSIDSNGITGKGFLYINQETGTFAGDVFLEIKDKFSVRATGILVTKLPNGEKGFSLIVTINFIFPTPVQLGYGFTMNGLGGILGIHRRAETDKLRANVRSGAVGNLMFPPASISSDQLITNLQQFFPVEKNRHLIGFMARIAYAGLVTGDLGVILEVPSPIRILILGSIKAILPKPDKALLQIRVDFLGVIEFDPFYLSFDASLIESYIGRFPLYGDLALRIIGGDRPNFLFTAGGYHPAFTPPPQSPSGMRRLELSLSTGDQLTVNATSYFALTSNSVQLGAAVYAAAKMGKAGAEGHFSLDALFYFKPFYFRIDVSVSFAITWKGDPILSASASIALSGPNYWNVNGEVTFEILKFDWSVPFNKTWGDAPPAELPENRSVLQDLLAELSENRSWTSELTKQDNLVTYCELEGDQGILIGPSGQLKVNQRVTPLNYTLTKYGSAKPTENPAHFKYTKIRIGQVEITNINYFKDFFAPSLFRQINGTDQVTTAPFEKFDSGVEISTLFDTVGGEYQEREMVYERLVIDFKSGSHPVYYDYDILEETRSVHQDSAAMAAGFAADGPGGNSGLASTMTPDEKFVRLHDESFVVVSNDALEPVDDLPVFKSRMQALQAIEELMAADPSMEGTLQVVSEYEMA